MIEIGLNKGMLTMNYKITSDKEILEFLSEANKITFKWSNLLFDKKHFKFLCVFWNHPERIKKLIPSDKISEWEKDTKVSFHQVCKDFFKRIYQCNRRLQQSY